MSDWRTVRLDEVATVTVGHVGPMVDEYQPDGIPFLRSQNVRPHRIDLSGCMRINEAFHARLAKSALVPGDVVTVRTGKPGTTAVVPSSLPRANCSDVVITRPGPAVDSTWLSYFINAAAGAYVSANLVGAVQQHFNVKSAKAMLLHLPPQREQVAIAEVLGALDDKIAANTNLIQAADALAAASLARAVESSADPVPLSSLAEFVNGKAFTKGATGTGRVVIRIAELNSGIGGSTVYNDIDVAEKHLARPGDLLFAWSGSLTVHRWHRPEGIVNQHIFKVIPIDGYPLWLVNGVLRLKLADYRAIAADKATTMGHIQRHHLDERVRIPRPEDVRRLDAAMSALWDRALAAEVESLKLEQTRDALLPLLMSGEVRVQDAEKIVEGSL